MCNMAWDAVCLICKEDIAGTKLIDLKRFARIEKVVISDCGLSVYRISFFSCVLLFSRSFQIPGGELSDCRVLDGIILDKDVVHPRMRRSIPNPRIVLYALLFSSPLSMLIFMLFRSVCRLDCPLEFKKGESQTNIKVCSCMLLLLVLPCGCDD